MKNTIKKIIKYIPKKIKKRIISDIEHLADTNLRKIQILEAILGSLVQLITKIDFHGQYLQDMIAYLYFKGKKEGFYIDIGAYDGKTISNTIIFEQIGWEGICVEPLPDVFEKLQKNRNCDCVNAAISNVSGKEIEFIWAAGVPELSGISDNMTNEHKQRIEKEKGEIKKIYVKALHFTDLMNKYPGRNHIDFMSIDVEGVEMDILETIDFKEFKFGLITIEKNNEEQKMINYMDNQGYKVYLDLGCDIMFIPQNREA